jgi:hypothetical protein
MSSHETYDRPQEIKKTSERTFGFVFTLVFVIVGLLPLISESDIRYWALAIAAGFCLMGILKPSLLRHPNRAWLKLGEGLHSVTTPCILLAAYILTFAPIGFLLRCLKKDIIQRGQNMERATYWVDREPPGPDPKSMIDQF